MIKMIYAVVLQKRKLEYVLLNKIVSPYKFNSHITAQSVTVIIFLLNWYFRAMYKLDLCGMIESGFTQNIINCKAILCPLNLLEHKHRSVEIGIIMMNFIRQINFHIL